MLVFESGEAGSAQDAEPPNCQFRSTPEFDRRQVYHPRNPRSFALSTISPVSSPRRLRIWRKFDAFPAHATSFGFRCAVGIENAMPISPVRETIAGRHRSTLLC